MSVPIREETLDEDFQELSTTFTKEFQQNPDFYVKTPGRVNLIGEHIDYCGYPVLPMAIQQNIKLAVKVTQDGVLHLKNANSKYESFKCAINSIEIPLPDGPPEWYKYFFCGVKGATEQPEEQQSPKTLKGMMVLVSGNIPPASGLSSSSALVSSALLAVSYANELPLDKQQLATRAAKCERFIGTCGGGMDQAIAFLAEKNTAQYIEWNPLQSTTIHLPKQALFVIANSLTEANKAATSDFNQRVIECRLGCRMMAKKAALNWREMDKFAELQKTLHYALEEMEDLAKDCIPKDSYTRNELLKEFGITEEELNDKLLTPNTRTMQVFYIRQRAIHVFHEAQRVEQFRLAAEKDDLEEMARLMRASHRSLTELYECSHKNLDKLVDLADGLGKVGARLTGAGWGGCIIALCGSKDKCEELISELKSQYYNQLPQTQGQALDNVVFISSPQSGAEILLNP